MATILEDTTHSHCYDCGWDQSPAQLPIGAECPVCGGTVHQHVKPHPLILLLREIAMDKGNRYRFQVLKLLKGTK